jgi:hypothetical protein
MGFFDDLPPRPPPEEVREPDPQPWEGPPGNEVGVSILARPLLARTSELLVGVVDMTAYSTGFAFDLVLRRFEPQELTDEWIEHDWWEADGSADAFRFGLLYADGTKVTEHYPAGDDPPTAVLWGMGGGGGGEEYHKGFWAWPIPPYGPVTFVCEWKRYAISEQRVPVDGALIRGPSQASAPLWSASKSAYLRGAGFHHTTVLMATDTDDAGEDGPARL